MRASAVGLLEKADLAVACSVGVATTDALEPLARAARNLRFRLSYPDDVLVAALAGGTGSGKSSLLNAIVGVEMAMVGGMRPTTDEPLAAVPRARATAVAGYLDDLGVPQREPHDGPEWLCLLDLPDTDSVEVEHRFLVEELLPRLDLVVWVVDPEKYRDAVLHDRYLKPLRAYSRQFVFVLNQIDRLHGGEIKSVVAHFTQALTDDGISSPQVIAAAAAPPAGPAMGIEELLEELRARFDEGVGLYDKLLVDLGHSATGLLDAVGGAVEFEARATDAVAGAAVDLARLDEAAATARLTSFFETLVGEAGGSAGEHLQELAAAVPVGVHEVFARWSPAPPRRWRRFGRAKNGPFEEAHREDLRKGLEERVLEPVRAVLLRRAEARAALADLALNVEGMRQERLR